MAGLNRKQSHMEDKSTDMNMSLPMSKN